MFGIGFKEFESCGFGGLFVFLHVLRFIVLVDSRN